MPWNDSLLPDQEIAASYYGTHARLLAGPGTGKTLVLTRRIVFLVQEQDISPNEIIALTFTRAAAHELRQRIIAELGEDRLPRISTRYSFALRQLLRNSQRLVALPQPLRIADDWEERNIILEDIKAVLGFDRLKDVRELFTQLSSDWQSLAAEEGNFTPDPRFIGAWEEHRAIFGYTLRSELVYQLKRALEQISDFELEAPLQHLLVDEYQDLNQCDLAIINSIVNLGVELYVAGDDDQSIYGFRKAYPEGIRRFPRDYPDAIDLPIEICKRCDVEILNLAEFVVDLDTRRIRKGIRPEDGYREILSVVVAPT
jgi:DNA helicase-2/ATP-dependent DNA helicase PcrA